jgi:hypothetical protein
LLNSVAKCQNDIGTASDKRGSDLVFGGSIVNSKITLQILAIALTTVVYGSATPIMDINQLPGSALGNYGLVVEGGAHSLQLTSDSHINGNVALGSGTTLQGSGDTINGNLDFQSATSNGTGSVTVTGTTSTNSTLAGNAVADAENLISLYSAATSFAVTSNTLNVSTTPGDSYNSNSHEHVYSVTTAFNGALAITAAASEYVIVNVGEGSSSNYSLGAVSLSGGITSDHVLFVIDTTGQLSSSNAHGDTINGIILDGAGKVNVDNFTLNGRLFCNTANSDCQDVSGAKISSTVDAGMSTPEPLSFFLAGSGLVLAFAFRRFRASAK